MWLIMRDVVEDLQCYGKKNIGLQLLVIPEIIYIDLEVAVEGMGIWRLTGYHGFPKRSR